MLSLSDNNQTDIFEAFNSTSRYLDDLLYIENPYFEQMVFAPLSMVYIFLSLFVLLECALMLMTLTTETYF